MESAVFGGATTPILAKPREAWLKKEGTKSEDFPNIAFNLQPALTMDNYDIYNTRRNDQQWKKPEQEYRQSPIPLYYYEEIQQEEFWTVYTSAYGGELLKPRPLMSMQITRHANMQREKLQANNISYRAMLAKTMNVDTNEKWWTDDFQFNNPIQKPYFRRQMERDKAILLRIELSRLEQNRHSAIRIRDTTPQDALKVERYKQLRENLKKNYDRQLLEDNEQDGAMKPVAKRARLNKYVDHCCA